MQKKIHFIGIGGIGNSALAQIFHRQGCKVSGSDQNASSITRSLKLAGIEVHIGHNPKNIKKHHNLIIYSPAIPTSNPELKQAKKLKIKCQSYPQALGELTKKYFTIAISGTHGKSTTTAMTALALKELDPTVVVGTKVPAFKNRNFRVGKSKYLIIEACEYKDSFQHFQPDILIITNVEAEHLDYFKNLKNYKATFEKLANKVTRAGKIIINGNNKNSKDVTKSAKAQLIAWKNPTDLKLKIPGRFNQENATFALKTAEILGVSTANATKALAKFGGTWRRMEYKRKKLGKLKFIDDYGHHPTEIELTLNAIREKHPKDRILCIFQPHQYSRTKMLLKEFGTVFTEANEVIIPNIYRVRDSEEDVKAVSTDDLVKEINKHCKKAKNGQGLKSTADYIKKHKNNFDLVVTMGAGDIHEIYKKL